MASSFQESTSSYSQDGDIRPSIAVSIDGEIATGGVLDPVNEDSEVHFIPALGGGCLSVQKALENVISSDAKIEPS